MKLKLLWFTKFEANMTGCVGFPKTVTHSHNSGNTVVSTISNSPRGSLLWKHWSCN